MRVWTSRADGRQFSGTLVKTDGDLVSIRRESDQVVFEVKRSNLIPEDGEWIEKNAPGKAAAASPVEEKKETFAYLHTALPDNGTYARGWLVTATAWSQGPALAHDGSNPLNYCSLWIAPGRKAAIAAFSNCGEKGDETCRAAIELVVDQYLK